jgi:beta-glucanase (GH16 family)
MTRMHPLTPLLATVFTLLTAPDSPAARPGWDLVWQDDFTAAPAGAPDPDNWVYETGMLRNHEAQCYTKDRRENVRVEGGSLVIEARKEHFEIPGKPGRFAEYTSGSIQTKAKADWLYGRIEVKAKLPAGRGTWPAIWMMPTDGKAGWPACGEIDIMENVGFQGDVIHGTVHTKQYNHVKHTEKTGTLKLDRAGQKPSEAFHIYAIEWDERKIDFIVDDAKYFTFENDGKGEAATWPFDKPFYLKLNFAVGGDWGGAKGVDEKAFPQKMQVAYVRVYQRAKAK